MTMNSAENFKLVICDVRDGSLISQQTPIIPGVEWIEVPGTRTTAGNYFQADFAGRVPVPACENLPEHCFVKNCIVKTDDVCVVSNLLNLEQVQGDVIATFVNEFNLSESASLVS